MIPGWREVGHDCCLMRDKPHLVGDERKMSGHLAVAETLVEYEVRVDGFWART